ncbi:MAG TPA: Ku protein [Acidimicrobiia bacterium]|nr:Ku protein [Acidimicrobiia bacterium]
MPRSIWKGAVSFGLVTIPVALYTATESKTPKFKMLRGSDHSAIKYKRVAEADGEEVAWDEIVRGYEVEKGRYVVFTDEELEAASSADGSRLVDVVQFVDEEEIDPIYYKSSYYLAPERTGVKAYKILHDALVSKGKIGLAKVSLRDKQHLATIRAKEGVLVMETMFWPDEIRQAEFEELEGEVEVRAEEVKMAEMLIDGLTTEFDPSEFHDQSREAIEAAAKKKVEGQEIVAPEAPEPTKVVDLLEALKASVEQTKARKAAS